MWFVCFFCAASSLFYWYWLIKLAIFFILFICRFFSVYVHVAFVVVAITTANFVHAILLFATKFGRYFQSLPNSLFFFSFHSLHFSINSDGTYANETTKVACWWLTTFYTHIRLQSTLIKITEINTTKCN